MSYRCLRPERRGSKQTRGAAAAAARLHYAAAPGAQTAYPRITPRHSTVPTHGGPAAATYSILRRRRALAQCTAHRVERTTDDDVAGVCAAVDATCPVLLKNNVLHPWGGGA